MRLRILSRSSDLARLQALSVSRALQARWPDMAIEHLDRPTLGDRDQQSALSSMIDKGAFTADLSDALVSGDADIVVHSWKDLPLAMPSSTTLAGTLERADPRDVLLVRRDVVARRPDTLSILSSSPRRAWLLERSLRELLPWRVTDLRMLPVRGNIPTRLAKLLIGDGDALVVAKAALDRLLGFGPPFDAVAGRLRRGLEHCRWMVLPLRDQPGAPAQGALAVEVSRRRADVIMRVKAISHGPTWQAVEREREILGMYGGGCHQAVGATVLVRDFGVIESVRGQPDQGGVTERWVLDASGPLPTKADPSKVWPRRDEQNDAARRALEVPRPSGAGAFWVARADALPASWAASSDDIVWAAGGRTWRALAARGIWVHGCADGLGDGEAPNIDALADRAVRWLRLTHADARMAGPMDSDTLATYVVDGQLPENLASRTHFYWGSGSQFLQAIARWPELRTRSHASGPGRTRRLLRDVLGDGAASVWLDRDDWYAHVTG